MIQKYSLRLLFSSVLFLFLGLFVEVVLLDVCGGAFLCIPLSVAIFVPLILISISVLILNTVTKTIQNYTKTHSLEYILVLSNLATALLGIFLYIVFVQGEISIKSAEYGAVLSFLSGICAFLLSGFLIVKSRVRGSAVYITFGVSILALALGYAGFYYEFLQYNSFSTIVFELLP